MARRRRKADSYGDEYSMWRDYGNPQEVGDTKTPDDYVDGDKPIGMGGSEKAVTRDRPVTINWFRGKKNRKR